MTLIQAEFRRQPLRRVLFPEVHDLALYMREPEGEAHEPVEAHPPLWTYFAPLTLFFVGWALWRAAA